MEGVPDEALLPTGIEVRRLTEGALEGAGAAGMSVELPTDESGGI